VAVLTWIWLGMAASPRASEPSGGALAYSAQDASQTAAPPGAQAPPVATQTKPIAMTDRPEDEKAIQAVAETFTHAYNAGDYKAVGALFTEDAEMMDESGARIKGRPTIQAFFEAMFRERKGAKIEISPESLSFLGPDVATELGHTRVRPVESEASDAVRRYTVLFVKQGGKWLYSSVHEDDEPGLAHHERLKELEWLLGEWVDETADSNVHVTCRWSPDKNYLLRDFSIHVRSQPVMTVTQRIGWDPLTRQIKSWVFDSEGGYGDGFWTRDGNQWVIKSTGVLPDGRTASATHILTRSSPQLARWASIHRTVGGHVVPDLHEYVLVRRPPKPGAQRQSR
jgi:uncharacterized protein (TIGR02246 family)